jgi:cytoskeletal protein CcmA (bactofilin family)
MALAQGYAKPDAHSAEISTLLGRGSEFEGKLTFEGAVRIDGKLSGEIFSDGILIVGEGAEVNAEIDIGEIVVQGTITGNIRAKRSIEIKAPAKVKGDITTPSLQIDKGVIFEGKCFMEAQASDVRPRSPMVAGTPSVGAPHNNLGATMGPPPIPASAAPAMGQLK